MWVLLGNHRSIDLLIRVQARMLILNWYIYSVVPCVFMYIELPSHIDCLDLKCGWEGLFYSLILLFLVIVFFFNVYYACASNLAFSIHHSFIWMNV